MPLLGLGVWQVPNGPECENAVRWALELGYRHIDTAQAYGNEESVGRALRDSGIPRDEVFITTKFYPRRKDPAAEAQRSLERLGVDQVDLYIIHWPQGGPTWAWPGMEQAARARVRALDRGLELQRSPSSTRCSASPPSRRSSTRSSSARSSTGARCSRRAREREVAVEAYSPLGTGRHLAGPGRRRDRRARSGARRLRCCSAGACSAARRDPEVDPSRADRGERAGRSTSRSPTRTWPRSTRSTDRRDRRGARVEVVVRPRRWRWRPGSGRSRRSRRENCNEGAGTGGSGSSRSALASSSRPVRRPHRAAVTASPY